MVLKNIGKNKIRLSTYKSAGSFMKTAGALSSLGIISEPAVLGSWKNQKIEITGY